MRGTKREKELTKGLVEALIWLDHWAPPANDKMAEISMRLWRLTKREPPIHGPYAGSGKEIDRW